MPLTSWIALNTRRSIELGKGVILPMFLACRPMVLFFLLSFFCIVLTILLGLVTTTFNFWKLCVQCHYWRCPWGAFGCIWGAFGVPSDGLLAPFGGAASAPQQFHLEGPSQVELLMGPLGVPQLECS